MVGTKRYSNLEILMVIDERYAKDSHDFILTSNKEYNYSFLSGVEQLHQPNTS